MSARGAVPWSGPRKPSSGYGPVEPSRKPFDHLEDLYRRRSVPELEAILAERLDRIRTAEASGGRPDTVADYLRATTRGPATKATRGRRG